jgi:acetyl/propionyl-CoA carboxylase alpha subunit
MKLTITVDGRSYEVDVAVSEPEPHVALVVGGQVRMPAAPPVAVPAPATGAEPVADEGKVCRSPVNGVVAQVIAQPGQSMQVGDVLLVLEAMKMETKITAPVDAQIARVNVAVGDAVRGGQVLVEFE